jgi:WD40-like Beta Propeller Repeat
MRIATRLVALLLSVYVTDLAGGLTLAAPRCTKTCRRETAACKQTQCTGLAGERRRACVQTCNERRGCPPGGPAIRTLAYVVHECRTDAQGFTTGGHALRVRHGDCDPVTVYERGLPPPAPPDGEVVVGGVDYGTGICRVYGEYRWGAVGLLSGGIERLGVRPDGSAVVFEVTDDTALFPPTIPLPPDQAGIYVVRADGSGRRRLGPASSRVALQLLNNYIDEDMYFAFSPDGRTIVYTDLGPDAAGEDTVQVVTLDVTTGRRAQLTRLPAGAIAHPPGLSPTCCARFLDAETIGFASYANPSGLNPGGDFLAFTINRDGTGLRAVPAPVVAPGGAVVPVFGIGGPGPHSEVLSLRMPYPSTNHPSDPAEEVFLREGRNLTQLTNFGLSETVGLFLTVDRRRVIFSASADPLGANSKSNCQLFSIDTVGAHLRQLTHFVQGEVSPTGHCITGSPPGCSIPSAVRDRRTGTIVFESSCDPFGTNPYGSQLFAMRPDGSGLRALTDTRGLAVEADGSVMVELPGPFDYAPVGPTPQLRF